AVAFGPDVLGVLRGRVRADRVGQVHARVEVVAAEVGLEQRLAVTGQVVDGAHAGHQVVERDDVVDGVEVRGGGREAASRPVLGGQEGAVPVVPQADVHGQPAHAVAVAHEQAVVLQTADGIH